MTDPFAITAGLALTAALAGTWGLCAWLAAEAWQKRALAAESVVRSERRKRSQATSKGNRTRAEIARARVLEHAEEMRRETAARRAAEEPSLPFSNQPTGDNHG